MDTNGAGDAFVGGFLAQWVLGNVSRGLFDPLSVQISLIYRDWRAVTLTNISLDLGNLTKSGRIIEGNKQQTIQLNLLLIRIMFFPFPL